jgi:energy-coupling factor transporter ATP-binding protein EcfA2
MCAAWGRMTTEADALADIVDWSSNCPAWQRDALRRLATQSSITPAEIDELVTISKGGSQGTPIGGEDVRNPRRDQGDVRLRQIHTVTNVNALAENQHLVLQRAGLTIVYGDNGSGKSGYARILKKACRARTPGRTEEIIPDIYDAAPGTPAATIEYVSNGQNCICAWQLGQPADAALSAVSVFDSRTANVHVDETNDVAYTPFPLKLLAGLAQLCRSVRDKLSAEVARLQSQTPQVIRQPTCTPASPVGQLMNRLTATTDPRLIEALATLSSDERERLAQLTADLAGDPARAARQLEALKAKIEGWVVRFDELLGAIGEEHAARLLELAIYRDTTVRAAEAASAALFRDEPLPQVGSQVWQALWESARAFSLEEAYRERDFPVTDPGSVCVLCQQDLAPVAADRLNRFEAFVRDDSKRRAEAAHAEYSAALEAFNGCALSLAELKEMLATVRDGLRQDSLADDLRRAALHALWRHRQIKRQQAGMTSAIDAPIAPYARQAILDGADDLGTRAAALTAEADSPGRLALIAEKAALADRQWLEGIKLDVLAEIERRKQIARLQDADRSAVTNRITAKSTEIAQALVTDALRAQFAREVASFDIADLAVELRQQTSAHGVPRFKVALTRKPTAAVGQVLSEGEHRCVALAAFMAELATTGDKSGIVFDDPVSSLDHMHREAVARRLIAEASQRQVIVFTHDLAFLFELNRAADDADPKPQVAMSAVSRGRDKAGYCRSEPPFKARRVSDITDSLGSQLANERYHFDQGNQDEWRKTVKSIVGALRDTWEIAVEEVVGYVIRRLSHDVKTHGLVKLTAVTVQDCETMRNAFGRCSELLHSAALELNRPLPRPEVLAQEIGGLAAWADDLRQRQTAVKPV